MGARHPGEDTVRTMLAAGELDLVLPAGGHTAHRWAALADWGRADLAVARLAEGHADAVAILAEASLRPETGALYGVWAARSGTHLATFEGGSCVLRGSARFCSGAGLIDRALVVARPIDPAAAPALVEVRLDRGGVHPDAASWQADGMARSDTLDVRFADVTVERTVGGPGWYTERPGFALGGGGVAAVWWGGAAGVLRGAFQHLRDREPDQHQLAHLGELHALVVAARALLRDTADGIDAAPAGDHGVAIATTRSAVERSCRDVVDRVPRILGPGVWSGDGRLSTQLADLQMYVRQHHGERDNAALAERLLQEWA
ncbi:acyl-CoA dehydrogenase family protein [Pseudonocardia spinosispora]|uniref:acyl-CoA dehydrogenase family protein n=1 Tax=Pseudonocardia spinosispora TaxID=103441 RepID=UPI000411B044|nr:acyl-CoA dehydrogenase family protein [Pseudonocardia spinosispora]